MVFGKGKKLEEAENYLEQGRTIISKNSEDYELALPLFEKARDLFKKLKDDGKSGEQISQAFISMIEGFRFRNQEQWLEAMKAFGQSNILFSSAKDIGFATKSRYEQARTQTDFAKKKAIEGDFAEAARLYESAGAVFQMVSMEKEAANARARSYVQRAAQSNDDFEKANFLSKAVEEFRKAREDQPLVEAHALFYRGRSLINVRIREAIHTLVRAAEKYEAAGALEQRDKVRDLLQELTEAVKTRPNEFGARTS